MLQLLKKFKQWFVEAHKDEAIYMFTVIPPTHYMLTPVIIKKDEDENT